MDGWDIALLAACAYVAIMGLVKQMLARRDSLTEEFRARLAQERQRRKRAGDR